MSVGDPDNSSTARSFVYPKDLDDQYRKAHRWRGGCWICFLAVFWVPGLWAVAGGKLDPGGVRHSLVVLLFVTAGICFFERCFRRFEQRTLALSDQRIEVNHQSARQVGPNGDTIAQIDLTARYSVRFGSSAAGNMICYVWQDSTTLVFSRDLEDADVLLHDVFGRSWPDTAG